MLKQYLYCSILLLIFLTPFIVSPELFNGVNSSKQIWVVGSIALLLLLFSIDLIVLRDSFSLKLNSTDLSLLLFYLYLAIHALINQYIDFLYNTDLLNYTLLLLFYFIIKELLNNKNVIINSNYLFLIFLCFGLGQSILGLLQVNGVLASYSSDFEITGTFTNPAPYSLFLATIFPFPLMIYLFIKTTNFYRYVGKYTSLVAIFLIFAVLIISKIRAAWLAVLLSSLIILFYKYDLLYKLKKILKGKIGKVCAWIFVIIFTASISVGLYKIKPNSTLGRLFIWEVTTDIIKGNPIFGIGVGRYKSVYNNYQSQWFANHPKNTDKEMVAGNVKFAYNEYLELVSETGFLGLFLFLILLTNLLINGYRTLQIQQDKKLIAALTAIISILACSIISYPLHILPILLLFFFYMAIISSSTDYVIRNVKLNLYFRASLLKNILAIFMLAFSILLLFYTKDQYLSYRMWKQADIDYKMEYYSKAKEKYDNIKSPFLNINGEYLQYYGKCLFMNGNILLSIKVLEKAQTIWSDPVIYITLGDGYKLLKQYDKAKDNYLIAMNMIPHKLFPKYKLACLYKETNNYDDFIKISKEILNQKVKVESLMVDEIKHEINKMLTEPNPD